MTASNDSILVVVKFRIGRSLRFLSHAETVKLFHRACARAGIKLRYSKGFNPRPRLSLPLPRSVGVESEQDLLCLQLAGSLPSFDSEAFRAGLSTQLPKGCELLSVSALKTKTPFQPITATYVFQVRQEYITEELKTKIASLLASESLVLQRRIDAKGNIRNVDVRGFMKSVELDDKSITVECNIHPAGSIRVGEILKLLELDTDKLAAPIRRTGVQWRQA